MARFVAVERSSATEDSATIYALAIAGCDERGLVRNHFSKLIRPDAPLPYRESRFRNVEFEAAERAPSFPAYAGRIHSLLDDQTVVTRFGSSGTAVVGAFARYRMQAPRCIWVNACDMARHVWVTDPYDFAEISRHLYIPYDPTDVLLCAKAYAVIAHCALADMGITMDQWVNGYSPPVTKISPKRYIPPRSIQITLRRMPLWMTTSKEGPWSPVYAQSTKYTFSS